ncbi:MAG: hypothetical protein KKH44_12760 [Bacteroidetes bacterium]|nr:hypothetical protein [Bacteroidota bacterium]
MLTRYMDYDFYHDVPYPTATGNPLCYRQWEMSGVATKLAVADTIDVVSSSASDASDSELTVTVWGYVNNILQSESYTLNGTTAVTGSTSFDAREIFVSKSKNTVGTITITENSGSTTLTTIGKEERNPLHKVISLYPIPSAAITIYVEGWGHMKEMVRDGDTPPFDQSYHYVVRLGTLAKVYQHLGKDALFAATQAMYASGVRAMVNADMGTSDFIPVLKRHNPLDGSQNWVKRTTDDIA